MRLMAAGGRTASQMKKGFLKLFVLANLEKEPLHGYGIIKRISKRSNGFWEPKPGNIYPLLKEMVEEGLIGLASAERAKRKLYSITQKGRAELLRLLDESQQVVNNLVRTMGRDNNEAVKMHLRLMKELSPDTYEERVRSMVSTLEALLQVLSRTKTILKVELGTEASRGEIRTKGQSTGGGRAQ